MFCVILEQVKPAEIAETFSVLWKGMLGIFVAITLIFVAILVLNYINKLKNKKQK